MSPRWRARLGQHAPESRLLEQGVSQQKLLQT